MQLLLLIKSPQQNSIIDATPSVDRVPEPKPVPRAKALIEIGVYCRSRPTRVPNKAATAVDRATAITRASTSKHRGGETHMYVSVRGLCGLRNERERTRKESFASANPILEYYVKIDFGIFTRPVTRTPRDREPSVVSPVRSAAASVQKISVWDRTFRWLPAKLQVGRRN